MLKTHELSVQYEKNDDKRALDGVSFELADGERVALLGANGAGKSTLLLTLVGVLTPSAGEATLRHDGQPADAEEHSHGAHDGQPADVKEHSHSAQNTKFTRARAQKRTPHAHATLTLSAEHHDKETLRQLRSHVGMLFQNPDDQIFLPLVREDIAFGPANYGMDAARIAQRTDEILARLGISHLKERLSHKLSDGEKRLVGLAGVLIMEPFILLLDEPFTFLDRRAQRTLSAILRELDHTLILATHDFHLARELCDRAILLKAGRVAADGPIGEILNDEQLLLECGL